jgi:hypothetical protein
MPANKGSGKKEGAIVYLDTEGLAAMDQNQTHDTQVGKLMKLN